MRIQSPRFGLIEVHDDRILYFERSLPGFPGCGRFIVMDHDRETPIRWLQSVDRPELAFLIVEPQQVLPAYDLEVPPEVLGFLGWKPEDDARSVGVFLILNVDEDELTANLRAPVIVNLDNRRACQLILDDVSLPLRHPIKPQ